MAFEFDRYINGQLMAEGVTIERQDNLPDAMRAAARIASRGPNGEVPVLVLRAEALSRTGAVKVKALDWIDGTAACLYGAYMIHRRADTMWEVTGYGTFIGGPYADAEAAKAAAQADYEHRILSALEPAAPEGQQPVAYDAGVIAALLDASMKRDEIAVGSVKRDARVRELVHWFARLAQDDANPKWTRSHASELAYYIATTSTRPAEQAEPAAAYTIDYLGCEYVSRDVESIERIAASGAQGPTDVVYLYERPAAVTEAEHE